MKFREVALGAVFGFGASTFIKIEGQDANCMSIKNGKLYHINEGVEIGDSEDYYEF